MSIYTGVATVAVNPDGTTAVDTSNDTTPYEASSAPLHDTGVNTAAEARNWNERLQRLEREANDQTSGEGFRQAARIQLDAMKKATPSQLAYWKQLDAQRRHR